MIPFHSISKPKAEVVTVEIKKPTQAEVKAQN